MKRDMDLIRKILLKVETSEINVSEIEGVSTNIFGEHVKLLLDEGLVEMQLPLHQESSSGRREYDLVLVRSLTNKGHDLCDKIRDDKIYKKALASIKVFSFEALQKALLILLV